jgi:hypothetical protein
MLKLWIKDYFLHTRSTFIFLLLITGYCIWISFTVPPALAYAGFSAIFVAMIPLAALAREDKLQSVVLSCSLPVKRDDIIFYKYFSGWLVALAGLVYVFGLGLLIPGSKIVADELLSLGAVFFYLTVGSIFLAFVFPFIFRFGFTGLIVFLLVVQFLGAVLLLVPMFFSTTFGLRTVIAAIPEGIAYLMNTVGVPGFYLTLVLFLFLLNVVSWKISAALFRRRDL